METVPSFYHNVTPIGGDSLYDGEAFGNDLLRVGEVKQIILPTDSNSRSKKFLEYNVLVQHRENGTTSTKIYRNCVNLNSLCGIADKRVTTLRIDDTKNQASNNGSGTDPLTTNGYGSKVLLLCINAEHGQAVVIGGIRNDRDTDVGLESCTDIYLFNGTTVKVEKDGSYSIQVDGATKADGSPSDDRVDGGGSSIRVASNGDITIATADNAQQVLISNQNSSITIKADQQLIMDGQQIQIGENATEPAVLGNQLASLLTQLLPICAAIAGAIPAGAGSPMVGQLSSLTATISTILSTTVTVKQ